MSAVRQQPKNLVQIEGRVVFDPRGNPKVTNFVIDVPTGFKENLSGIACVAWHSEIENHSVIEKDRYLRVEGRIVKRSYDKNGAKVYVTEVVCDSVTEVAHKSAQPAKRAPAPPHMESSEEDDDLPF